jgi:GntR family transcriptional regulator
VAAPRYAEIADDLLARITAGEFSAGRVLPSEAELSAGYDVSRVTVRKALERLRGDGLVDARQGFGWFVAADPSRLELGRLGTMEAALAAQGRTAERRVLEFGYEAAAGRVLDVLGRGQVLRVRRVGLADGVPFARVTVWVPEALARSLSKADVERETFHTLLPVEVGGAVQSITAAAADARDAELLEVPVGSPVLLCERITRATDGSAVLLSEHVLPGLRAEFVVDLPAAGESLAPSGLRLVDAVSTSTKKARRGSRSE